MAMAAFALEDAFIKAASAIGMPTGQILIVIGIGGGAIFGALARRRGIALFTPVLLRPAVLTRNVTEVIGTLGFVTAITTIPLATASAILQATPLVITMGAALFFSEPVGWRRWTAIGAGFAGVLVIIRPGLDAFDPWSITAVIGVLGLAGRDLASRAVPVAISNLQVATYGFLTLIPTGLIMLAVTGGTVWPDTTGWLLLLGAIAVGTAGYYSITAASRTGEVAVVTPFRYTRLPFALLVGWVFFTEVPDALTYVGAALIIASGIYTFLRERRLARLARDRVMNAGAPV
ncbi:Permease of the drug/metabolite transporter (DMT) superfamily [Citreimonas salinaria]|uniref:Permease of the drug/metabolite transporter (DMT) superfamily n=2 Tax=Citreimonas salinaria TaxID=321339 RepID=A0A1H3IJ53_9RHOB|nr:Permease of the drug/metabolite transporter (DMT) superfamily [Citreimonas salinaria]